MPLTDRAELSKRLLLGEAQRQPLGRGRGKLGPFPGRGLYEVEEVAVDHQLKWSRAGRHPAEESTELPLEHVIEVVQRIIADVKIANDAQRRMFHGAPHVQLPWEMPVERRRAVLRDRMGTITDHRGVINP